MDDKKPSVKDIFPIKDNDTVAVARFSALGDVAMTVPALYAVCEANPHTRFVMLTRPALTQLYVNAPDNLVVCGVDVRGEYRGLRGLMRLARRLAGARAFVDLHDVLRTRILGLLLRMRGMRVVTFDKCRGEKNRIVHHRRGARAVSPTVRRYCDALQQVTGNGGTVRGVFHPTLPNMDIVAGIVGPTPKSCPWVGIAPFAAHDGKVYPVSRMLEVARLLHANGCRIFLFGGGKHEAEILEKWRKELGDNTVNVAAAHAGLTAELHLMGMLDTMVCMDSGNMHMAAIAGIDTVSVWGATHPDTGFIPATVRPGQLHIMVQNKCACRPCSVFGNKPCATGTFECMDIPAQQIADTVLKQVF